MVIVLSIAGSDPSSGAGIQADMKTFSALDAYGLTVITVITSQNTERFSNVEEISVKMVKDQLDSVLSDFKIDAIKIGMVYSSAIIKAIYSKIKGLKIPIVLDPVFESTTGGILLKEEAYLDFKRMLVPLCFVITPNIVESEKLIGMKITNEQNVKEAACKINQMGAKNVIIKGGHLKGNVVRDFVLEGGKFYSFFGKRVRLTNHGGGCNFSASLTAYLAKGKTFKDAVKSAKVFTTNSIINAQKVGRGFHVVQAKNNDKIEKSLFDAISDFVNMKNTYRLIPECQTNFVFAKPMPKSTSDILGVSGRIVKNENSIVVVGNLKYGGSKHVASSVLGMTRKFPNIRSALNIRYDNITIRKAIRKKFFVINYDRTKEPSKTKTKEGHTVSWGIQNAIKDVKMPPDLVFHKGDVGKEPMIVVFGKEPQDVLAKIAKII